MEKTDKNALHPLPALVLMALLAGFIGGGLGFYLFGELQNEVPPVEEGDRELVMLDIEEFESKMIEVIKEVSPAVVSVVGEQFSLRGDLLGRGEGTGFVVREDGLIVTNRHVVLNENASYKVVLNDGTEYPVRVVGRDVFDDVAILEIEAEIEGLPVMNLGDSDLIEVGQSVLSFGNALALYDNTVTSGIISGKGRDIAAFNDAVGRAESLSGLLQTDAPINRGNSGGPLVNLHGEVIGVNVAVADANGIGFAIPINDLKPILNSVEKYGEIVRPILGVRFVMLNEAQAETFGVGQPGALVSAGQSIDEPALVPGGPAEEAGVLDRDVIVAVDGKEVSLVNPLHDLIRNYEPDDVVTLKIWRAGEFIDLRVKLGRAN